MDTAMLNPPFKRSAVHCCDGHGGAAAANAAYVIDEAEALGTGRARLSQLDPNLHCSVIGTCISTAELRKLMARYIAVKAASDLDVHHEAVRLAMQGGDAAKALHKALDQRHASTLRTFAKARDEAALAQAWAEASRQGEIPGAYWALLTHRHVTADLRQQAFGEVHMLSHRVGSSNRADLRRLVAIEKDKAELAERFEREQQRRQALVSERDGLSAQLREQALLLEALQARPCAVVSPLQHDPEVVGLQTERRERAEQSAASAWSEVARLESELERLRQHAQTLGQELNAAEYQLHALSEQPGRDGQQALGERLRGRALLYVGGRPSSTPAIRDLVRRHGGEFLSHDGGLEVRKGLLDALVPKADLVVFPVDCIDHDSALKLKRLCERHGLPFLALRNASVASFAAALSAPASEPASGEAGRGAGRLCLRQG